METFATLNGVSYACTCSNHDGALVHATKPDETAVRYYHAKKPTALWCRLSAKVDENNGSPIKVRVVGHTATAVHYVVRIHEVVALMWSNSFGSGLLKAWQIESGSPVRGVGLKEYERSARTLVDDHRLSAEFEVIGSLAVRNPVFSAGVLVHDAKSEGADVAVFAHETRVLAVRNDRAIEFTLDHNSRV